MRRLRLWWQTLSRSGQYSPPHLVEAIMLALAMALCGVWYWRQQAPYLILCISYILGAIASIMAREWIAPSPQTHRIRLVVGSCLMLLLICVGLYWGRLGLSYVY